MGGEDGDEAEPVELRWVDQPCRAGFATMSLAEEEETHAIHDRCLERSCRRGDGGGDGKLDRQRAWPAGRPAIGDRRVLCTSCYADDFRPSR